MAPSSARASREYRRAITLWTFHRASRKQTMMEKICREITYSTVITCMYCQTDLGKTFRVRAMLRAGLKPIEPTAPNLGPAPKGGPALECNLLSPRLVKYIQVQTLVQVDWEPGPTEIVPNWAPHLLRPALTILQRISICVCVIMCVCVCVVL